MLCVNICRDTDKLLISHKSEVSLVPKPSDLRGSTLFKYHCNKVEYQSV